MQQRCQRWVEKEFVQRGRTRARISFSQHQSERFHKKWVNHKLRPRNRFRSQLPKWEVLTRSSHRVEGCAPGLPSVSTNQNTTKKMTQQENCGHKTIFSTWRHTLNYNTCHRGIFHQREHSFTKNWPIRRKNPGTNTTWGHLGWVHVPFSNFPPLRTLLYKSWPMRTLPYKIWPIRSRRTQKSFSRRDGIWMDGVTCLPPIRTLLHKNGPVRNMWAQNMCIYLPWLWKTSHVLFSDSSLMRTLLYNFETTTNQKLRKRNRFPYELSDVTLDGIYSFSTSKNTPTKNWPIRNLRTRTRFL